MQFKNPVLPCLLFLVSLITFFLTIAETNKKIGQSFPGYLTFKNGVVGAFYLPHWSGHKEGMTYHKIAPSPLPLSPNRREGSQEIFSRRDFFLVALLPAATGLLFILLGTAVSLLLPSEAGRLPLLLFHFLVGNYLILAPDFHLTYRFTFLLLACFSFIPAAIIHFALLFPERAAALSRHRTLYSLPTLVSLLIFIPYSYFFLRNPPLWIAIEHIVVFYVVASYLFWIARLVKTFRRPQLEFNRIIARYLLVGQVVGFIVPLTAVLAIFVGGISIPLNLAAQFILLFPISLFVGVTLGRLRRTQMELVLSEKRAALGNLLASLAHELNNPMTFIYSALEPLRDSLQSLKGEKGDQNWKDVDQLVNAIEEGATRSKAILENFRFFSYPGRQEPQEADLHEILEQSVRLLTPKWKDRIAIVRKFGKIPKVRCHPTEMGQVFVNLIANACDAITAQGTIEISTTKIDSKVIITIRDTGQGIAKESLPRIFDPFYTTKGQGEGTGLGLATTLEIVKKHGGTIDVKSEVGKGAEFVITLPLK